MRTNGNIHYATHVNIYQRSNGAGTRIFDISRFARTTHIENFILHRIGKYVTY